MRFMKWNEMEIKAGDLFRYTNRYYEKMTGIVLEVKGEDVLCFLKNKKMWLRREFLESDFNDIKVVR